MTKPKSFVISAMAIKDRRYAFRLTALWLLVSGLSLVFFNDLYWVTGISRFDRAGLFFGALCFSLAELMLLVLGAGLIKALVLPGTQCSKQVLGVTLGSVFIVVSVGYFMLLGANLALYSKKSVFINSDLLRAFFLDFAQLYRHLTGGELVAALIGIVLSLLISVVVFLLSPIRLTLRDCRVVFRWLAAASIGGWAFLLFFPLCFKNAKDFEIYKSIARNQLSPTVSVIWSPAVYYFSSPTLKPLKLKLTKRYDLPTYFAKPRPDLRTPINVILFVVEALRYDIVDRDVDGRPVTPVINRLAKEGKFYRRAFAQSSESAYSLVSLVTGLYPLKYSYRDTYATSAAYPSVRFYDLAADSSRKVGVFSSSNLRWGNMIRLLQSKRLDKFFHAESADQGHFTTEIPDGTFELSQLAGRLKTGKIDDRITTQKAVGWIGEAVAADRSFLAFIEYQSSHFPYQQGVGVPEVFAPSAIPESDRLQVSYTGYPQHLRQVMLNRYYNSLHYIDSQIAEILANLEKIGALSNTVIIVAGDHGELFGEQGQYTHAGFMLNLVLHVPIIIWGADDFQLKPEEYPVMLIDLPPTVTSLIGLPLHDNFQGSSLVRDSEERKLQGDRLRPVFASVQSFVGQDAVIVWPWKLIRDRTFAKDYLFNVELDPGEMTNVILDHPVTTACLSAAVEYYRNAQLYYYGSSDLRSSYFPPRYGLLSDYCTAEEIARFGH